MSSQTGISPRQPMQVTTLLQNALISAIDYRCDKGPGDEPYRGVHENFSLSYLQNGSFTYHALGRSYEMTPGSMMVGYPGDEYVCTFDRHVWGDRCLQFHFAPDLLQSLGRHCRDIWRIGRLPVSPDLMMLGEMARAAADGKSDIGIDEAGMLLAAGFVKAASGRRLQPVQARVRDRHRAVQAAQWIEAHSHEAIDLERAANEAGLSPFHFLRFFTKVIGITPHQYLIRARLRQAARLLIDDTRAVTDVALDVGFGDVSNFIRTFHRAAGVPPRNFRRAAKLVTP